MMKTLVRICAGRPVAVVMILMAVLLAGIHSARHLPLGRLPEISVPKIIVEATMPGLPAAEVRSLVTTTLEDVLVSAKGLQRISSVSRDGRTVIVLDFLWGEDPVRAAGRVREILDAAYPSLPEGSDKPTVLPFDPVAEPLIVMTVHAVDGDLTMARHLADYSIRSRLGRIEGVGAVNLVGGMDREVSVLVDTQRAASQGLTVNDVAMAISTECVDVPAGSLREGDLEIVAMARGKVTTVEELSQLVTAGPHGISKLSDIATVSDGTSRRKSLFVADGSECVALEIYKRPGADPVATARRIREAISGIATESGAGVRLEIIRDTSVPIAESIRNLAAAGAIGSVIAALVLFAFLGKVKAALLVAATIPLSVTATLGVLGTLGRTLNGMSLGGIALAIGMISDNAVVVLDALDVRLAGLPERPGPDDVADATANALSGTFGSMVTTTVVFIPVLFLPGAIGALYGDLALSIIVANAAGWLTAVLAVPSMYRAIWTPSAMVRKQSIERVYRRMLGFALRRPMPVIFFASCSAIVGFSMVLSRPLMFMPKDTAVELKVLAVFPTGSDPDGIADHARNLCTLLADVPGIAGVYGRAGSEDNDVACRADPDYSLETLTMTCSIDRGADTGSLVTQLSQVARAAVPVGTTIAVREPVDPSARILGLDTKTVLAVRADTQDMAQVKAKLFEEEIIKEAGTCIAAVVRFPAGKKLHIYMTPDRQKSAALGVGISDTARIVRMATEGVTVAMLENGGRGKPVRVSSFSNGGSLTFDSMADVSSVPVSMTATASISASSIVHFERREESSVMARSDRADTVYLELLPAPGMERKLAHALDRFLVQAKITGSRDVLQFFNESAFRTYGAAMAWAITLVLALLYLTLGVQFESFSLPIIIMLTIPLAMAGAGPALLLTGIGLDSGSILGLVVLFGIVVNNAILLYETSAARKINGSGVVIAAYAGASDRVRPVLATMMTTVAALLPICLASSGAVQRSMSIALLGGIVASTLLTLFVSPIAFAFGSTP
jgi:multidrug efflux pump subunit AcrB